MLLVSNTVSDGLPVYLSSDLNLQEYSSALHSLTNFNNPIFQSSSILALALATTMFILLQVVFFVLLSVIVRNKKKYLVWIMLISSIMLSPWVALDFYDLSFLILWLASIYLLYQAIFNAKTWYWLFAGLTIGFGIMIRSYMVAIPIGVLVFLIFSTKYRPYIFSYKPYLMLFMGFVLSAPFFQGLVGLSFNSYQNSAFGSPDVTGFHPSYFLKFSLTQVFLLMPILFIGLWWLLLKYFGRIINKPNQVNPEFWFLLCFFIPMYIGVYVISFFYDTPSEQLLPIYLVGLIIFGKLMKKRWVYWHIGLNAVAYVLLLGLSFFSLI